MSNDTPTLRAISAIAVVNPYALPNERFGPLHPETHDEEGWENVLVSGSRDEILEALVFLGGTHVTPTAKSEWADLVARVKARPGVRAALERLLKSDDAWVREEARLVYEG